MSYIGTGRNLIPSRDTFRGMRTGMMAKGETTSTKPNRTSSTVERFDWLHCSVCDALVRPNQTKGRPPKNKPATLNMPKHAPPRGGDVCKTSGEPYTGTIVTC